LESRYYIAVSTLRQLKAQLAELNNQTEVILMCVGYHCRNTIQHVQKSVPVYLCHVIPLWTQRLEGTIIKFWPLHSLCKLCNYGENIQCCHVAFKFKFLFCSSYVSVKILQRDSYIWMFVKELHAGENLSMWDSDCSGMLHKVDWCFFTNVSGKTIDPVFRGQAVQGEFLNCLTLEGGTNRLSWNVGN